MKNMSETTYSRIKKCSPCGKWQCERKKEHLHQYMQHLIHLQLHSNANYTEHPGAVPCTCYGNTQDDQ